MKRRIRTYGGFFEAFMKSLTEKEQEKIQYGLLLLKSQDRLSKKFVKLIRDDVRDGCHLLQIIGIDKACLNHEVVGQLRPDVGGLAIGLQSEAVRGSCEIMQLGW